MDLATVVLWWNAAWCRSLFATLPLHERPCQPVSRSPLRSGCRTELCPWMQHSRFGCIVARWGERTNSDLSDAFANAPAMRSNRFFFMLQRAQGRMPRGRGIRPCARGEDYSEWEKCPSCGQRRRPRTRGIRRCPRCGEAFGSAIGKHRRSVSEGIGQIGVHPLLCLSSYPKSLFCPTPIRSGCGRTANPFPATAQKSLAISRPPC